MPRRLVTTIAAVFLGAGLLIPAQNGPNVAAEGPFTHFARIPVGADLRTIRFEKVKTVKVRAVVASTGDANYCREAGSRDPGGSMACPQARGGAPVEAYEVTYSYTGPPLASDEYANRNFTFSVYFRPNELSPDAQRAIAARKISRADAAGYFAVSTYREQAGRVAIDDTKSRFCPGTYVDGVWTHNDPRCEDKVVYREVSEPSGYITVQVDAVPARRGTGSSK